jgi:hypothetical protein
MIDSNDLIHHADDTQYGEFSTKMERIPDERLADAASKLGANMPEGSTWQDYRDAFAQYSWHDVTRALEDANGGADYANL